MAKLGLKPRSPDSQQANWSPPMANTRSSQSKIWPPCHPLSSLWSWRRSKVHAYRDSPSLGHYQMKFKPNENLVAFWNVGLMTVISFASVLEWKITSCQARSSLGSISCLLRETRRTALCDINLLIFSFGGGIHNDSTGALYKSSLQFYFLQLSVFFSELFWWAAEAREMP